MGVIEVEIPDCLPLKPLKKKINDLIKEEETKWVLFERSVEDLDLAKEDLLALEEVRERVWKEEKKSQLPQVQQRMRRPQKGLPKRIG